MSSSYIIEPQDNGSEKKDDTLIIFVNDNNTLTVDQETIQTLIMNQSDANVSVVKIGQADTDTENGDITLTVDPPSFAATAINPGPAHPMDPNTLVDPFMEMDPEQLERLETALQSEEAKQILGENVTAMLDMLTVEEQQNSVRHSVKLDHCYTSRSSPSDPKPRDPLPLIDSPTSDEGTRSTRQYSPTPGTSKTSSPVAEVESLMKVQPKAVVKISKPVGRPRKNISLTPVPACNNTRLSMDVTSTPKTIGHPVSRNLSGVMQSSSGNQKGRSNDGEDEELTSSSDSFESEPSSDNDSDFGPRGPRRGGVRARGGRKGLTTRGGSLAATRRRGPNKHLDMEQVRRLDMEMAAAVNAMKSPDKEEKSGGFSIVRGRRQIKTLMGRKKEESPRIEVPSIMNEDASANFEKPLQTKNQVKANLINANMIKGDMIITKPGQGRTTPKVTFVQKQMLVKSKELAKDINVKKHVIVPKGKFLNQPGTKFFATKDGQLIQIPVTTVTKTITSSVPVATMKGTMVSPTQSSIVIQNQTVNAQQSTKTSPTVVTPKIKSYDIKKEKKKPDNLEISVTKSDIDSSKTPEIKLVDNMKKHPKKETRKSPAYMVNTLGPALFSTPDIIRRVGSNGESKVQENVVTSLVPTTPSSIPVSSVTGTSFVQATTSTTASADRITIPSDIAVPEKQENLCEKLIQNEEVQLIQPSIKSDDPNELQPTLDSTGIESEEHLLASLVVEATKNEDELLAEALLLQEELGVELTGNATLVEQGGSVPASEPLTSDNTLIEPLIGSEQETVAKSLDMDTTMTVTATTSSTTTLLANTSIPTNASKETIKRPGKDDKEPIKIIRGGRIITLPPIEAPATRSKRLQIKTELAKQTENLEHSLAQTMQQKPIIIRYEESVKEEETEKIEVPEVEMEEGVGVKDRNLVEEEEEKEPEEEEGIEDDDDDEEEENSDSEDDPDRLWCICKRPHNNRFMICCDVCEDWFHGKCVHVSKAMGQQMEEKGIEWICPNCDKKKDEEAKAKQSAQNVSEKQRIQSEVLSLNQTSLGDETSSALMETDCSNVQYSMGTQCVVCKKEARNSSIYCSDTCILAHAQETLTKDKPLPGSVNSPKQGPRSSPIDPSTKSKLDARVIVLERKTGRVLTGPDAPTRSNLRAWLKEHPTFEVVGTNNVSTLQLGKAVTTIQTQAAGKTGKPVLLLSGKGQNLPKMTYTKVPSSKQMVLMAGNKKLAVVSTGQQQQQQSPTIKVIPPKQMYSPQSSRSPLPKNVTTRVVTPQSKQLGVSSPKHTPNTKKQELKQTTLQSKQQLVKPSPLKKPETEPIRLNVRKTLSELLSSRIKETEDLNLTDEEISDLALNIELELYKYFKDTGAKYKAKYRSLVFNIKDTKNLTLFRKIADRSLTPDAVVKLSPDAMASQELAEWREKETKHQLEMIKKNELDMMAQAKSIVVKTHKGEQIIENEGAIDDHVDPKTPVQDIVTALNNTDSITSTVEDTEKDTVSDGRTKEEEEKLRTKEDGKRSKSIEDKRKDKDKSSREKEGRERDKERRMKESTDRHSRSSSRTRHKREREDRAHTKIREKSRERKSRDKGRRDKDREKERDRSNRDRERSKIRDKSMKSHEGSKEKSKQKVKEKEKERERHRNSENNLRTRSESKDVDKREEIEKKRETEKKDESSLQNGSSMEKSIEDRLWRHIEDEPITNTIGDGNDSDVSDREPSSTVTIKTPDINEDVERDREQEPTIVEAETLKGSWQTVWRGFVNMVDVAKFFITAQEVSGHAKDLMDDLPDTVDVVGRISHETVWDYISKMKKTGSKEILVIRLTAANDEEKIPYITLYSYLNSRSRLGVVGNVSKNIKDFYIMPFSNQSTIPPVLLPLNGPGFEERRPHLLLGIIVRNKRKRIAVPSSTGLSMKLSKKDDRSYTPPLLAASASKDKLININSQTVPVTSTLTATPASLSPSGTATSTYHQKTATTESTKEKQHPVTQTTLDNLNRAHIGMPRSSLLDTAAISKIVPELSSKIDLDLDKPPLEDDGDEPYSPGQMDEEDIDLRTSAAATSVSTTTSGSIDNSIISSSKNSNELERKMEELNRQIEEQKQQIQSISSSFLAESTSTLPGLGLDPPVSDECEEAYSPSDPRSFTPPPPGISKFSQPILEKVSNITIPPNLQEILANVKRQESSKVDPYLPSKPGATFLTTTIASLYPNSDKYSSSPVNLPLAVSNKSVTSEKSSLESIAHRESVSKEKESKSTLSSLSDMDLIRKAEEELAAVAAASSAATTGNPASEDLTSSLPATPVLPSIASLSGVSPSREVTSYKNPFPEPFKRNIAPEQPKPPGLEDEDFPSFPSTPPNVENSLSKTMSSRSKFLAKSGIVLNVKRKGSDDRTNPYPSKAPRVKSRWGLGPSDSAD